jgi:hypothetical protein
LLMFNVQGLVSKLGTGMSLRRIRAAQGGVEGQ